MVVYVGDRKSWEGQFSDHPEEGINGFYLEHCKGSSISFSYTNVCKLFFYGI